MAPMNSGERSARMPSVRMLPGSTPFTVMPSGASSIAAARIRPLIPALLAE